MKFCSKCGKEVFAGNNFCGNCGAPINNKSFYGDSVGYKNPINLICSYNLIPSIEQHNISYNDTPPFSVSLAINIIHYAIDLVEEFCREKSENFTYISINRGLCEIYDRLQKGDHSKFSETEINFMILAADLFLRAAVILEKEPASEEYDRYIQRWLMGGHNLCDLIAGGLESVDDSQLEESQTAEPSIVNNFLGHKWHESVRDEIEQLEAEMGKNAPMVKVYDYDPKFDYWRELQNLVGLEGVKKQLKEHISTFRVHQVRQQMHPGLKTDFRFNCIFKGRPGTGKTTIARILAGILKSEGIIQIGQCVEADASSLTSGWIGFTSKCTRLAALKAVGGVLFVDEAYSLLANTNGNNTGSEAIDTLTPIMSNYSDNLIVVLAGYEKEMDDFMNSANTGLASRFHKTVLFEDYSEKEMVDMFLNIAQDNCYKLETQAVQRLHKLLNVIVSRKDSNKAFANARTVRSLFDAIRNRAAQRYINNKSINPDIITVDDIALSIQELQSIGAI